MIGLLIFCESAVKHSQCENGSSCYSVLVGKYVQLDEWKYIYGRIPASKQKKVTATGWWYEIRWNKIAFLKKRFVICKDKENGRVFLDMLYLYSKVLESTVGVAGFCRPTIRLLLHRVKCTSITSTHVQINTQTSIPPFQLKSADTHWARYWYLWVYSSLGKDDRKTFVRPLKS